MICNELTDTVLKFDFANHTNLESEIAQRAPQVIFDVINLPLQQFARGQQKSSMLAGGTALNSPTRII